MIRTQGTTGRALGLAVAAGLLAGCSTSATSTPPTATPTSTQPLTSTSPAGGPSPAEDTGTPTALACGTPPKALVARAGMSIAAHPGPITATTYVFAATTDTGDWYVLGLDRTYVHDDGTPAQGPDGEHSRSLALTNASRTTDGEVAMIPLSVAVSDRTPVSWERVSWTGDTLAAGRHAADTAIACLEAQRSS